MSVLGAVSTRRPRDTAIDPEPGSARRRRVLYVSPDAADLADADPGSEAYASVETWDELDGLAERCARAGIAVRPSLHAAELIPYPDGFFDLICASDAGLVSRAAPELARALARGGEVRVRVQASAAEAVRRALSRLEIGDEPAGVDGRVLLTARHPVNGRSGTQASRSYRESPKAERSG
jgi:hypothetical protein